MRKRRLTAICAIISVMLLFMTVVSVSAEEAETATSESTVSMQVFILPFASNQNNYTEADPNRTILGTVSGLMQLAPTDGTALYTVIPIKSEVSTSANPAETAAKIDLTGGGVNNPGNQINRFEGMLENAPEKRILVILDSSGDYRSAWSGSMDRLYQLAEQGTTILFVEIQNNYNSGKQSSYTEAFTGEDATNRLVKGDHENLWFCWINSPQESLNALIPFAELMTGVSYQRAEQNESGSFELTPFATLTEETLLLMQGQINPEDILIAEGTPKEITIQSNSFTAVKIGSGTGNISIPITTTGSVYYTEKIRDTGDISLTLLNLNDRNEFFRNDQTTYYVSFSSNGIDVKTFANDLESHDRKIVIKDQDGNIMSQMDWDEANTRWNGDVTFDTGGHPVLHAEIELFEGVTLKGNTVNVTVNNRKPVLALGENIQEGTIENPIKIWIRDPWNPETSATVSIPVTVEDDDGDQVTVTINDEEGNYTLPGAGTLFYNKDQGRIVINGINEGTKLSEPFRIQVKGNDGENDSDVLDIVFVLEDLEANLGSVKVSDLQYIQPVPKKTEFNISFTVDVTDCTDPEGTLAVLQEKASYQIHIAGDKTDEHSQEMVFGDGAYSAGLTIDTTGGYSIAVTEKWDGLGEQSFTRIPPEITLGIRGDVPRISEAGRLLTDQEGELQGEGDILSWDTESWTGTALFSDGDEDPFSICIDVQQNGKRLKLQQDDTGLIMVLPEETEEAGETLSFNSAQEFKLRFREEGAYSVIISATDEDGESEPISFKITTLTLKTKLLNLTKKYAPYAAGGIILLLILIHLLKPSYKKTTVNLSLRSDELDQNAEIPLKAWKKAKKPLYQLMTCAAFPPEPDLYEKAGKVMIKPTYKGIKLLKAKDLTGEKDSIKIDPEHPLNNCQIGDYTMTIETSRQEKV